MLRPKGTGNRTVRESATLIAMAVSLVFSGCDSVTSSFGTSAMPVGAPRITSHQSFEHFLNSEEAGEQADKLLYEVDFSNAAWSPQSLDAVGGPVISLDLTGTSFSDADFDHLLKLDQLRVLNLMNTQVNGTELDKLTRLPGRLQELTLCNCPIGNERMPILARIKSLYLLNLTNTGLTDEGIASLRDLSNLEVLVLSDNSAITDRALEPLKHCRKLKMLGVYNTLVTTEGVNELKAALPSLQSVMGAKTLKLDPRGNAALSL